MSTLTVASTVTEQNWRFPLNAKQWLKDNGFISEITRGRISTENHARLAEAVANGVVIDGYKPREVVNKSGEARIKNVSPTAVSGEKVIEEITIPFPDSEWIAVESISGVKRSVKEACQQHGLSLSGHHCLTLPVITSRDGNPQGVTVSIQRKA